MPVTTSTGLRRAPLFLPRLGQYDDRLQAGAPMYTETSSLIPKRPLAGPWAFLIRRACMLTIAGVTLVSCATRTTETRFTLSPTSTAGAPKIQVLTQHNNNARTGANLEEQILTTGTVRKGQFGFLASRTVNGQIYAQPLYVSGVVFSDHTYNVVYVATMHNSVYAFDADNVSNNLADDRPLWQVNLGTSLDYDFFPMKYWIFGKYNISPEIGILSTPVIDTQAGTIYVVAKVRTPASEGGKLCIASTLLASSPVEIGHTVQSRSWPRFQVSVTAARTEWSNSIRSGSCRDPGYCS
jgi:hypothetical protein